MHGPFIRSGGPGFISHQVWDCARRQGCVQDRTAASIHSSGVFVFMNQGQIPAEDVGVKNGRRAPPLREKPHAHHKAAC